MKYNLHQWVSASGCWYKHKKWKFWFTNLKLFKLPCPLAFHLISPKYLVHVVSVLKLIKSIKRLTDTIISDTYSLRQKSVLFMVIRSCEFFYADLCFYFTLFQHFGRLALTWMFCKRGTFIEKVNKNDKLEHAQLLLGKSDGGHKMQETR